jgi:L-seryl-tRNA(Ser) seleniumtransferase
MGRPMKVGKEEICGLLKAVELYVARDHAADLRYWEACAQTVLDAAQGHDGVTAERFYARTIAQARLTIDPARAGDTANGFARRLREGDPSIVVTQTGDSLVVNPHNLEPYTGTEGEADQIALRLRALLRESAAQPALATA